MVMEKSEIKKSDYVIFLNDMEDRLSAYYDVTRDYPIEEETLDLYAEYKESVEDYFILSMLKVYMYHVFAHILVKKIDNLTEDTVNEYFKWVKTTAKSHLLRVVPDHYLTVIAMVIVAPSIDEKAAAVFQKAYLTKSIALRIKGSYDIALLGYDWGKDKIYYAKGAEEIAKSVFSKHFKSKKKIK